MKKIATLLLLFYTGSAGAQTVEEWLRQKETAKKYSLEQLAALRAQLGVVQKGYNLVRSGWQTIARIKEQDLSLHHDFFSAAEAINPAVRNSGHMLAVIAGLRQQAEGVEATRQLVKAAAFLHPNEKDAALKVLHLLLRETYQQADQLTQLLTSGGLRDEDRLNQLVQLLQEVQATQALEQSFRQQVTGINGVRKAELAAIDQMKKIGSL